MERTKAEASIPMTMDNTEPYICISCPTGPRKFSTEYDLRVHELLACFHCEYCSLHLRGSESGWKSRRAYHLVSAHKCGEWDETNKFHRGDHSRQLPIHGRSGINGPSVEYPGNPCRIEKQDPDQVATTTPQVPDEGASYEAHRVPSNETYRRVNKRTARSEHSVDSRASEQSTPSTGSQVSDESIEAGHSAFYAMDDLIEEHLKEAFPKPRLMTRKTTTHAKESYKTAVKDLLHKIHKHYALLYGNLDADTGERDESLVVLYDDIKLAFNGLVSQILVAQVSDETYTRLTLQVSEFGHRLDQCMGLEPEKADTRYAASQNGTWPSQLAHDKSKHMGTRKYIKMIISRNKSNKSRRVGSLVSKATGWRKSRTVTPEKTSLNVPEPAAPNICSLFICDCCPRKPKKFDNPDDLRAHEMMKPYSCLYCKHRFNHKNEAEQHQNSLHLRQYSWSCATLMTFQAVFDASISPSYQTKDGPSHDICGYCGEEFPNFPQADWDRRFEHLTTIHKFGECNHTKKFYRVDHFQQHLKHSHAGKIGKWTNVLENACMKGQQRRKPLGDNTGASAGASSGSVSLIHSPVQS